MVSWAILVFSTTPTFGPYKDHWQAFSPSLWASSPILDTSVARDILGGCGKTFLFFTFFPRLHILDTRGKKVVFWPFLDLFQSFWRTSWLKKKQMSIHTWSMVFSFSVRKGFKMTKKWHILCLNMGTCTGPDNFKQLGRPNMIYAECLVKVGLHLTTLWIHEKRCWRNKRTNKQMDRKTNKWMDKQTDGWTTFKFI